MRYYLVYRTENLLTGHFYYGVHETNVIDDGYLGSGRKLKEAIKKYGVNNFKRRVVARCRSRAQMYELEKKFIAPWIGDPRCYNLHAGGKGGWQHVNQRLDKEARRKIGSAGVQKHVERLRSDQSYRERWAQNFQRKGSDAARHLPRDGFKGRRHTEETRKRMSESAGSRWTGASNPQAGKRWIYHEGLRQTGRVPRADLQAWLDAGWQLGRNVRFEHRRL